MSQNETQWGKYLPQQALKSISNTNFPKKLWSILWTNDYIHFQELSFKYNLLFCIFTIERSGAFHKILSCKWAHSESTRSFPTNKLLAFVSKYDVFIQVEWVRQKFKTLLTLVLFAHSCGTGELRNNPSKKLNRWG